MKILSAILIGLSLSTASWTVQAYDYPIENALAATVVGTPQAFEAVLPEDIRRKELSIKIFPDRPTIKFAPRNELTYSLAYQKQEAPLIFVIAGTGASHRSTKMRVLEKSFYAQGFHVISLPSPTYANFILAASESQVPGHIVNDSADIYRVMERVADAASKRIKISTYYVTGYSLGGAQAAFVAKLDEQRKRFNFSKVLMINPPVSLFNSVDILDKLLDDNIPGGRDNFNAFFQELMTDFATEYTHRDHVDFNDDFLYSIYQDRKADMDYGRVAALIGMSFRISSSNMIFTSDAVTNGGYIVPKNHELQRTESTTDYFKVATRIRFTDYFRERFYPYFHNRDPSITEESLKRQTSLESIADYLRTSKKIAVMHNADDIILAKGELDFFKKTFGDRATIYPHGGHCGNISYRDNVRDMVRYFTE